MNRCQIIQALISIYPSSGRTLRLEFVFIVFTMREAELQLFGNGRETHLLVLRFAHCSSRDVRRD
jgi:hypothetical protein